MMTTSFDDVTPRKNRLRVLSVDDDDSLQGVLEVIYGGEYALDEVGSISAALDCLTRQRYDLLILDVHLPDGNGTDLLRAMRKDPRLAVCRDLPVIMLSASTDRADVEGSWDLGSVAFVQKPFEVPQLTEAIEMAVEGRARA